MKLNVLVLASRDFVSLETVISSVKAQNVSKEPANIGLVNVSNQFKTEQSKNGLIIADQQFLIDDELRNFFKNEMHALHISSDECDSSFVR